MSFSPENRISSPDGKESKDELESEISSETRDEKLRREYEESVEKEAKRRDDLFKEATKIERHTNPMKVIEEDAYAKDKKIDRLMNAKSHQQIVDELDISFEEQAKREIRAKRDAERFAKLHQENQSQLGELLSPKKNTIGSILKRFFSK